jgi:hypothetical protein
MENKKLFRLGLALILSATLILAATQKFDTIQAKKIVITGSGGFQLNEGQLDVNGKELVLDEDGDTIITADTDDRIDFEIGGTDEFIFNSVGLDIGEGTVGKLILDADGDTSAFSSADDQIILEMAGSNHIRYAVGTIDIANAGTAFQIDLDVDNDTSFRSSKDDQIDFELGGADHITMTATALHVDDSLIRQNTNVENLGQGKTILSTDIAFGAAAGSSGTIATIGAGELWFVHSVFISVTVNFDATGDDATLVIGDGNDPNGFIDAADANLQTTFTEATGFEPGFYGIENGSSGAYTTDDGGPFVYKDTETIDFLIDEVSGETLTAGKARVYVIYTRIQ